jgi:hypothetical protein
MIADRVKELSTSTGTGFVVLAGAVTGFESFNTAFGVGPSFDYCIESVDGTTGMPSGAWEIGSGHLSDPTTLVRSTVRQSSNADALVAFAAGTKNVFCTLPASVVIALQAKLDDAPSDGKTYGRKDAVWSEAAGVSALNAKEDKASKGIANGYASLDASTKVPAAQLPSYVDDVLEFANLAAFPATGATGIIYVALDTGKIYRWSGSAYIEISPSPGSTDAVPEGSINLYYTSARASAAAPVQSVAGRTGTVTLTKSDVGLANVDNTSDASKPVSTATQAGLDGKVSKAGDTMTGDLTIAKASPAIVLNKSGSAERTAIWLQKAGINRWTIAAGDNAAEAGSNSGSDFSLYRWDDAGAYLDAALFITRATGNVGIGTSTPGAKLDVVGDLNITGVAYKPGGGSWTAPSDVRIKDVLGDYTHGLAEVLQLLPVRYTFKGNYSKSKPSDDEPPPHQKLAEEKTEFVGLIAQQAEKPMPEMVTTEVGFIDGKPVADLRVLDTTALVFALVNACKELAARVAALEGAA